MENYQLVQFCATCNLFEFLQHSHDYYRYKRDPLEPINYELINWLYQLGKDYNILPLAYYEYVEFLIDGRACHYNQFGFENGWFTVAAERLPRWYPQTGPFRVGTKYQKKAEHGKKEVVEKRERKKEKRPKWHRRYYRMAYFRHRDYRRWQKQTLFNETYELFTVNGREMKTFSDYWF